jgi:aminopeptidase Y
MANSKILLLGAVASALHAVAEAQYQKPLLAQPESASGAGGASKKPLVSSEELQASISSDALYDRALDLYGIAKEHEAEYNHPTRVIGSGGHTGTLEYILSELGQLGDYYQISQQPFSAYTGRVFESRLALGGKVQSSAEPFQLTPPTKHNEAVFGDVILVENEGCEASDFPSKVKGNIAFIRRGTCPFGVKSEHAGKSGAIAAVIYNSEKGELHGTLGTPVADHVATFGISDEDAKPLLEALKNGTSVDGSAYIDAEVKTTVTDNIIAQTIQGDPDNCVMLGGHSDSVTDGPGINDDGSGTLALLEIATQLSNFSVNNCVRFAWWAGEEEGLLGSDYYVSQLTEEENLKIRLFMDYDMLGSPNFAYQIYNATNAVNPTGSEELRDLYIDWYKAHELNYTFIPFDGRSDYDGFIRNGIPGGGIATGAEGVKTKEEVEMFGGKAGEWYDPCYHQLCDDVGNVNTTAWLINTQLVAHSVATYAISFKDFPERTAVAASSVYEHETKYHGHSLFI